MNRLLIISTIGYFGLAEFIAVSNGREANRRMIDPEAHGINPAGAAGLYQLVWHLNVYSIAIPVYVAFLVIRYAFKRIKNRTVKNETNSETRSESDQTAP